VDVLSFDIEDWFHIVEVESLADPAQWPDKESLVERYTEWIVQAVTEAGVRCTFFVLGWTANRYPHLVQLMVQHGHDMKLHRTRTGIAGCTSSERMSFEKTCNDQ
jgi:hypothetical protein